MKRLLAFIIIGVLLFANTVSSYQVDLPYEHYDNVNLSDAEGEYTDYIKGLCAFTGMDYLKEVQPVKDNCIINQLYRSRDGVNWEFVMEISQSPMPPRMSFLFNALYHTDSVAQIINTGNEYLVRYKAADDGLNRSGANGEVGVYDLNFKQVKLCEFDRPIVQMSYLDGVCYILLFNPYVLLKSADFENWEEVDTDMGVPIRNGEKTIMQTYKWTDVVGSIGALQQTPVLFSNGSRAQDVTLENMDFNNIEVMGGFYIANGKISHPSTDSPDAESIPPSFFYSKDGVYWARQILPAEVFFGIINFKAENGKLYVFTPNKFCIFNLTDLEAIVPKSDVYVELNGKVLGFDTPPVMENDRALVPMRFLFEQMGADVSWDDATQTATVKQADREVSFSVNSTSAKVNNSLKTMDTPARLINDKTMVPLRFLSEELGYNVEWDGEHNMAKITTD